MTIGRDTLSKAESVTVAAVEAGVPAQDLIGVHNRDPTNFRQRACQSITCGSLSGGHSSTPIHTHVHKRTGMSYKVRHIPLSIYIKPQDKA